MIRGRSTRIVATIGTGGCTPKRIQYLVRASVDVFRVNFSHGAREDHTATIANVRHTEVVCGRPLAVLAGLRGPKFRLGRFASGGIECAPGEKLRLGMEPALGDTVRVGVPHPEIFKALGEGALILLDGERVRLHAVERGSSFANTVLLAGYKLSDRKGINLPASLIPVAALTAKDRSDLAFALDTEVNWVALSFIQRAANIAELRSQVNGRAAVIAKIEKPTGLERLDEILDLCKGVMVAGGDRGVELNPQRARRPEATVGSRTRPRCPGDRSHPDVGIDDHRGCARPGGGVGRGQCGL